MPPCLAWLHFLMSILKNNVILVFQTDQPAQNISESLLLSYIPKPWATDILVQTVQGPPTQTPGVFLWATPPHLCPHTVLISPCGPRCSELFAWLSLLSPSTTLVTRCWPWAPCPGHQGLCSWVLLLGFALASEICHLSQPGSPVSSVQREVETLRPFSVCPWILHSGHTLCK